MLDPPARTIAVIADSSAPFGELDADDTAVSSDFWPLSVRLSLPSGAASLPNPLGGSALTDGWSLPLPGSSGEWTSDQRGVMATPTGTIQSVENTPTIIGSGTVVFASDAGETTSVGIRGQFGTVRWYRYNGSGWKIG